MKKTTKKELEKKLQDRNIIESDLRNIILNYDDYKIGYAYMVYQFIIDNSIFYVACSDETEGLDIIIDDLEEKELEGYFINVDIDNEYYVIDSEGDRYYDDLYIIGGNHGRYLYHGGNFRVEEINIYYKQKEIRK